jgi:hypothetical protein
MYSVKAYTVSVVRERLAQALDEAQRGEPVLIQRGDVLYRLSVEAETPKLTKRAPQIELLDDTIETGRWTWGWSGDRLAFRRTRR